MTRRLLTITLILFVNIQDKDQARSTVVARWRGSFNVGIVIRVTGNTVVIRKQAILMVIIGLCSGL